MKQSMYVLLILATAATAFAQTTSGVIVGTVTDPSGLAVVGADVSVTQPATGAVRKTKSLSNGDFVFNALDPGVYNLTVEIAGFKKLQRVSMNLTAAERLSAGTIALGPGMRLDFGALAKGYGAEEGGRVLAAMGVRSGLLDVGGCVLVIGSGPKGAAWRIGVQDPDSVRGRPLGYFSVRDGAVDTSGVY